MLVAFQAHNAGTMVMAITLGDSNQIVATAFANIACPTARPARSTGCDAYVVNVLYSNGMKPNAALTREIGDWVRARPVNKLWESRFKLAERLLSGKDGVVQ